MSRSRKKPYLKDKGWAKSFYWKRIRAVHKQQLRTDWDNPDFAFKNPKSIVNDWDYCDWRYRIEDNEYPYVMVDGSVIMLGSNKEDVKKACRK